MCVLASVIGCGKKIERLTDGTRFQKNKYVRLRIQVEKNRFGKDERVSLSRVKGA